MKNIIEKKSVNQIKAGDVVGITKGRENSLPNFLYCESDLNDYSIVTVISVCKVQCYFDGQKCGFTYKMICSDGNTYNIGSGSLKYFIFNDENAQ